MEKLNQASEKLSKNYAQNGEMKDLQLVLLFPIKEKVNGRI